ncbi:MAG TPA: hypothetical protein VEU32_21140 [Burkholderiales bacterium]|nr:hypothetical protein [Burkholderiales bacterium]
MRLTFVLIVLLAAPSAQAQTLGRLFFTPEQREALDARRKARVPDKPVAATVVAPTTRVDGYVKRSAGPSTVWINGESVPDNAPEAPRIDSRGGPSGSVSISVGESGGRVRLQPGETLDRGNGEVHDVLGDGEVRVQPKAKP